MQRNRWALVMTLCAVSHLAGYGQDKSLTIMTYNIHHANPPAFKDSIDVDAIAQVIVQQRADLVAVQEVDVRTNRSGKDVDEAAELARKTSMHYYFAKSIDQPRKQDACAPTVTRSPSADRTPPVLRQVFRAENQRRC